MAFGASRALNAVTLQASTGNLFQTLSMRVEKNVFVNHNGTRMWANAQPDGRPAEHRWRPLFNTVQ